ncbi:protein CWC15-like protein [Theileria orientalis]|uniref:Protein CWC15-like protein n=1 Tax=Theileria orientalis TaxID=68886 RepID=A0A976M5D8_THEOR|nr:protein CWC15-like protein [Theileria orientalis]
MSTAHRPTWHNAIGVGLEERGSTVAVSSKDQPAHREIKRRAPLNVDVSEEGTKSQKINETKRKLREKLEETEQAHKTKNFIEDRVGVTKNFLSLEDATKLLNQDINEFPEDEDDYVEPQEVEDEDEEEAALLRELEKIKKEKEEIRLKEQHEELQSEEHRQNLLSRNPLLNPSKVARWDEDVVFKNPQTEAKSKPKFLNDVVRSEFHKRFLHKYVS